MAHRIRVERDHEDGERCVWVRHVVDDDVRQQHARKHPGNRCPEVDPAPERRTHGIVFCSTRSTCAGAGWTSLSATPMMVGSPPTVVCRLTICGSRYLVMAPASPPSRPASRMGQ